VSSADGVYEVTYWSNVVIKHKGEMLWVPPAIYQSYCVIGESNAPVNKMAKHDRR
jgi:hypothetical protein